MAGIGEAMDNRVKMINSLTGSEMLVSIDRVEEYKAAGHKLVVVAEEKKEPAKARRKKSKK